MADCTMRRRSKGVIESVSCRCSRRASMLVISSRSPSSKEETLKSLGFGILDKEIFPFSSSKRPYQRAREEFSSMGSFLSSLSCSFCHQPAGKFMKGAGLVRFAIKASSFRASITSIHFSWACREATGKAGSSAECSQKNGMNLSFF